MIRYGIHTGKQNSDPTETFEAIKRAGFDAVLVNLSGSFDNAKQVEIIRSVGLDIDNCHAPWNKINHLWRDTLEGQGVFEMLRDNFLECGRFDIPRVVLHVSSGNDYPPISEIGMDRMARLIEIADKADVDICLENQRFFHFIDYIYVKLDCPRLKFCFDSGHEACFSQTKLALPKYRHKLAALHLHDNSGIYDADDHLLPDRGTGVDWDYVRRNLEGYEGVISLEVKRIPEMTLDEFYTQALSAAKFVKS